MPQLVRYTARFATPDWLERGREQVIELPVYFEGALVAPSAGTVSVFDAVGGAVVDEQAVTVAASVATYTVSAATLPATLTLSDRWQVRWTLTLDGDEHVFWRDAALVRRRLHAVVTDADLTQLHSELRAWMAEDQSSLQNYIDAAWDSVRLRLMEDGRWPYLVMSPWSLRGAHLSLALAFAFRDYSSSAGGSGGKYGELADHYSQEFDKQWDRLKLTYDLDQDDLVDAAEKGLAGQPVLMTSIPGSWSRWP